LEGLLYKGNDVAVAAAVVAIAIAVVPGKDSFAWSPTLQNNDLRIPLRELHPDSRMGQMGQPKLVNNPPFLMGKSWVNPPLTTVKNSLTVEHVEPPFVAGKPHIYLLVQPHLWFQ